MERTLLLSSTTSFLMRRRYDVRVAASRSPSLSRPAGRIDLVAPHAEAHAGETRRQSRYEHLLGVRVVDAGHGQVGAARRRHAGDRDLAVVAGVDGRAHAGVARVDGGSEGGVDRAVVVLEDEGGRAGLSYGQWNAH